MTSRQRPPANTTQQAAEFPLLQYGEMLGASSGSDAILAQEASGGKALVMSDTLPNVTAEQRAILESFGVVFGDPVPKDDLFTYAQLPEGWTKVLGEDDPRASYLLDDKGRRRAYIFYKAAYYDRYASISLLTRFSIRKDYEHVDARIESRYMALDGETVVRTSHTYGFPADEKYSTIGEEANEAAKTEVELWLSDRYPDWQSLTAYWD